MGDLPPSVVTACAPVSVVLWLGIMVGAVGMALIVTFIAWWIRGK